MIYREVVEKKLHECIDLNAFYIRVNTDVVNFNLNYCFHSPTTKSKTKMTDEMERTLTSAKSRFPR